MGKLFGGLVAVIGIGMAALPAGILASGFAEQLRRRRELLGAEFRKALEDGTIDMEEIEKCEALRRKLGISESYADEILESVRREYRGQSANECPNCGYKITG